MKKRGREGGCPKERTQNKGSYSANVLFLLVFNHTKIHICLQCNNNIKINVAHQQLTGKVRR